MLRFSIPLWIFFCIFTCSAFARLEQVELDRLAPDQTYAGFAEVDAKAEDWLKSADTIAKIKKTSLKLEVSKILNRELQRGITSYISPDGKIRITDGHHKVLAAQKIMRDLKISKVKFLADIRKDFHKKSWSEYSQWREENDPTYKPKAIRGAALEAYYKNLPASFEEMKDLPMRSAVGKLFNQLGLRGSDFKPFIQLRLGEEFAKLGVSVEQESDLGLQKIHAALAEHEQSLFSFIESEALPEKRDQIHNTLKKASLSSCANLYESLSNLKLPANQEHIDSLLQLAKKRSIENMDLKKLAKILAELKEGKKISGSEMNFLKESRKITLSLRSAIKLLATQGTKEEYAQFRGFVKNLGALNDQLAVWNFKGKPPESIQKSAKNLLHNLHHVAFKKSIKPKALSEFHSFHSSYLQWIHSSLENPHLTVGEYHDIRKAIRDYKELFTLMAENDSSLEVMSALKLTDELSKKLGKVKDGLLLGEQENIESLQRITQFDPDSKEEIRKFLKMMEAYN